ncbi:MAG: nucleotidyltransferase domain-containing protein [Candidatus Poribacteria bacterium]|nr:nucleotidyltransferase domain-containing protein [Candidatus Poribacteria bacterium]
MSQPTDTHRTTKDLSPEELKEYRLRLDKHFQDRKVDEELLQRAWHTAHRIAAMLYNDFGATQVAVFGSLAGQDWFSKWSDIDIAVWGLSPDLYLHAVAEIIGFSREFEIDLVDFENCKRLFRERIQNQAILIEKGETRVDINCQEILTKRKGTNTLDQEELIQRISEGYAKVKGAVQRIDQALQNIQDAPVRYRRSIEIEIARYLYDFYKQLENIFERIAREIDQAVPAGEEWYKALLQQMAESRTERAPVLSRKTFSELQKLLGFRHVFIYIYGDELDYTKTLENATRVNEMFPNLSEELEIFIAYLKKQEND